MTSLRNLPLLILRGVCSSTNNCLLASCQLHHCSKNIMETLLNDINHVCVYLDDILVAGINKDHLQNLYGVLERLESVGLTLKKSKCKFLVSSVEYLGHVIDTNSCHQSESKVRAIKEVPCPTSVTELRSFLGLLNIYHKFLPDLATVLVPLHKLLLKAGVGLNHR